eukprot:CAMPEP_0181288174 /NCGR_PEP_ID=MMETSP1101-20121128/187_1 /TAXON_ID=46948 /ORGANISM="Rhodomonas abbreviata, Strain Caron Lab Isolate" /LENGTH=192 /DNA_ID=CAMNT_0023392269 /DNA_START=13 /DNA_END=588 /DNA_ORIENTATION=+
MVAVKEDDDATHRAAASNRHEDSPDVSEDAVQDPPQKKEEDEVEEDDDDGLVDDIMAAMESDEEDLQNEEAEDAGIKTTSIHGKSPLETITRAHGRDRVIICLLSFGEDVMTRVCHFLPATHLCKFAMCCTWARRVGCRDSLWKTLYFERWTEPSSHLLYQDASREGWHRIYSLKDMACRLQDEHENEAAAA